MLLQFLSVIIHVFKEFEGDGANLPRVTFLSANQAEPILVDYGELISFFLFFF